MIQTAPSQAAPHPSALFEHALIVEDLDEPRQWLAEILPQVLPSVRRVDAAATLAQARAFMGSCSYGLALVDWGLPDGNSENLIRELVAARTGAVVIVATIHDDDAHVFPALRAGASGYILKSQPREVVAAQLRRIDSGELVLSPSIALRVLKHFHAGPNQLTQTGVQPVMTSGYGGQPGKTLTDREVDVLRLIAKGYKVSEVGQLLGISAHTVTSYIRDIYRKLGISSRAEATLEAARRGLVS
jgi:DNA-binding NarL/FixJ family response regulator